MKDEKAPGRKKLCTSDFPNWAAHWKLEDLKYTESDLIHLGWHWGSPTGPSSLLYQACPVKFSPSPLGSEEGEHLLVFLGSHLEQARPGEALPPATLSQGQREADPQVLHS